MCSRLRFPSNQSPHTKKPKMDAPTASRMAPTKNRASMGTKLEKMSMAVLLVHPIGLPQVTIPLIAT